MSTINKHLEDDVFESLNADQVKELTGKEGTFPSEPFFGQEIYQAEEVLVATIDSVIASSTTILQTTLAEGATVADGETYNLSSGGTFTIINVNIVGDIAYLSGTESDGSAVFNDTLTRTGTEKFWFKYSGDNGWVKLT